VPWLRRLVTGLSPRRPGFNPGSVHVGFVVDAVALEQVFLQVLRFSTGALLLEKMKKKLIFLFIFITGLHKKPQGCGASVAFSAGPFSKKTKDTVLCCMYRAFIASFSQNQQMQNIIGRYKIHFRPLHMFRKMNCQPQGVFIKNCKCLLQPNIQHMVSR
jgi:hypothetical protein